jgi:2-polyprenyl-6-methoxyphenol hydroxylase-like FAD-dependent oxidoreductase
MRVLIVGSGPAGLTLGSPLARRGHEVISVDRDPGPAADGTCDGGRHAVPARSASAPGARPVAGRVADAHDEWVRLGAEPITSAPGRHPGGTVVRSAGSRTNERCERRPSGPWLTLRTGHVDGLMERRGRSSAGGRRVVLRRRPGGRRIRADRPDRRTGRRQLAATAASPTSTAATGCTTARRSDR